MSSPGKSSITSRYLESLGHSPDSSPLRPLSRFNISTRSSVGDIVKEKPPLTEDGDENLSPIRRLMKEKAGAAKPNVGSLVSLPKSPTKVKLSSSLGPTSKLSYSKPSVARNLRQKEDHEILTRIVSGMSQSPSLKNLNKLKSLETKMKSTKGISSRNSRRQESPKRSNTTIETGRKSQKTYEYLCRITETKNWLEQTLKIQIDPEESNENKIIVDFASYLRNGILLAELAKKFSPKSVKKIYYGTTSKVDYKSKSGFQFKYTENINYFFHMLEEFKLPTDYRFELTDLYDLKNFPKVIFCLHALAYMLAVQKKCHRMTPVDEEVDFTEEEISKAESRIRGLKIPNFDNFDDIEGEDDIETTVDETVLEVSVADLSTNAPSVPAVFEEDLFESDQENISDEESDGGELRRDDESFWLGSTVENIHKKYEDLIREDAFASPSKVSRACVTVYSPYAADRGEEIALYLETIINLQAISRGSLLRYQMFVDKFMLKTSRTVITEFQSLARTFLLNRKLQNTHTGLTFHSGGVRKLQSFVRFQENDERFSRINGALLFHKEEIKSLQAIIRGYVVRDNIFRRREELLKATNVIIKLQSHIRYKSIKDATSLEIDQIEAISPSLISLQSLIRKQLFNKVTRKSLSRVYDSDEATLMIQSMVRGNNVRKLYRALSKTLARNDAIVREFQSVARGALSRNRLNHVLDTIYDEEENLSKIAAIGRGKLVRNPIREKKRALQKELNSIIAVQSCFRGVLGRFHYDSILDDLEDHTASISALQAIVRGDGYRKSLDEKWLYYNKPRNVQRIIKIQSYIRTKNQGNAYKLLTTMNNPPLIAIKKFAGLLNDSELEFDEEIKLAKTRDSIKRTNNQIAELEEKLDAIDLKVELLTRNKITLNELAASNVLHHTKSDAPKEQGFNKNLPKPLKEKVELYAKIFYLLQTKPDYFIRLFEVITKRNLNYDVGLSENIEDFILKVFGYSLHQDNKKNLSREEYLLTKLILDAIFYEIDRYESVEDYKTWNKSESTLKGLSCHNSVWELLLSNYYNLVEQRTFIKELFAANVESVIMDEELDLESHPISIYRSIIEEGEKRTLKPSRKPMDISPQEAIHDPETRDKFVTNLGNLRELSNDFLLSIESSIGKFPMQVRTMCNEIYKHSSERFPKESERFHLSVVGRIFMKEYFLPILLKPENYGITMLQSLANERTSGKIKKNLSELAKVLYQLVSMRSFGAKNVYLQPLNDYIEQSVELVRRLLKTLINVKDIESVYDMTMYDDIVSDQKPMITMTVEDCLSLSYMITKEIDVIAPSRSDIFRTYATAVNSIPINGFKSLNRVTLELNPVTEDENPMTMKSRTLFLEVKRCLLYLIQVQNGDNLVDLLVSHIDPEHEVLFKKIVQQERKDLVTKNIQKPYYSGALTIESYDSESQKTVTYDLLTISYHDLKRITLEKLLELEQIGEVTRQDGFQALLNEIANDIKAKHTHRLKLRKESEKASISLQKLKSKEQVLKDQLDSYNREIEAAIKLLHSSSNKKKNFWSKVFSRQFFYQRELKKNGRLPQFGSYKYSAKYLYDNGILLEINGMTLIEYELSASGSSKVPKLDISFSCDRVGIFEIEMRNGINVMGGALETVTLDDLLAYQSEGTREIPFFKGIVKFDANTFIAFIFRKFYDKR